MANKPMKTLTLEDTTYEIVDAQARQELENKIDSKEKGSVNGIAQLDENGKVLSSQLPITSTDQVFENSVSMGRTEETVVGKNSVALGKDVVAQVEGSTAFGNGTIAGAMGYYFLGIEPLSDVRVAITLSEKQANHIPVDSRDGYNTENMEVPVITNPIPDVIVGNEIYLVTPNCHYTLCGIVNSVQDSKLIVDNLVLFNQSTGVASDKILNLTDLTQYFMDKGYLDPMTDIGIPFWAMRDKGLIGAYDYMVCIPKQPLWGATPMTTYGWTSGIRCYAIGFASHVEGQDNVAVSSCAHVEGWNNIATYCAHSEGKSNESTGRYSHTEGQENLASGHTAHAEGGGNKATGDKAHVEGFYNEANGLATHAEGKGNYANGDHSHVEGNVNTSNGNSSHTEGFNNKSISDYSHAEGQTNEVSGIAAHVEGMWNNALGNYSHAEGKNNIVDTDCAHIEGMNNKASGVASHAEGRANAVTGSDSHVEGQGNVVSGNYAHGEGINNKATNHAVHVEGWVNEANGRASHVEGQWNNAKGQCSHAEGCDNSVNNDYAHVEGYKNKSIGVASHVEGGGTISTGDYQHVEGKYNLEDTKCSYMHITGNGSSTTRSNAFTINASSGQGWLKGGLAATGADYAEYFEWQDGNLNNEDRVGLLVTLDGDKIKLANVNDEVLGIISGTAAVLGDNYECEWNGKYLTDDFGRIQYEIVEEFYDVIVGVDEETNEPIIEKKSLGFSKYPVLNPDYDTQQIYVNRSDRPEWDTVGMFGKLYVRDNGTCQVNGYATVGENGIATASSEKTNMRVLSRVNENIVRVLLK